MNPIIILMPILFLIIIGILILTVPNLREEKILYRFSAISFIIAMILVLLAVRCKEELLLFYLTQNLPIYFKVDEISVIFAIIATVIFISAGVYSFSYLKGDNVQYRYFGFYFITFGVILGVDFSGNLVTLYLFYELMTLVSAPLVIYNLTKESIMAGLKYLFYSFCGAYMVLFGFFFLVKNTDTLIFQAGGVLTSSTIETSQSILLIAIFCMIIGFSVKAGMFPLHAWLTSAHPVAPAPASAVLSAIIVKAGVLGIIRVIFYIVGPSFIKGTWVQITFLVLSLITIFMGSMLAFREQVLKKRLAYSTISQVSYILFGLALLNTTSFTGSILHVVFHAIIKCVLFLVAGAIIHQTGKTRVEELKGIGKQMPITLWCFTFASLGLIGIPPTSGFISKWYLCMGSFESEMPYISWLGPVILLVSALLTAGYLLPIVIKGFLPGEEFTYNKNQKKEVHNYMIIPMLFLTILVVVFGMFPNTLIDYIAKLANSLL